MPASMGWGPFVTMRSEPAVETPMPPPSSKLPVESFVAQCSGQMIPLNRSFSYFSALPLQEPELRGLLYDPVAAVPPRVGEVLPKLHIVLVPYLEKRTADGREKTGSAGARKSSDGRKKVTGLVAFKRPAGTRELRTATSDLDGQTFLFLAVKYDDLAECHYAFYGSLAALVSERMESESRKRFYELIRNELITEIHGEIDEKSWKLKQQLVSRRADPKRDSKSLQDYFRQAMVDTLTLYLHGLCCDIDLEAGPRQLASRYIRRRLLLLRELLPPPNGFALFPEEL